MQDSRSEEQFDWTITVLVDRNTIHFVKLSSYYALKHDDLVLKRALREQFGVTAKKIKWQDDEAVEAYT